MNLLELKDLTIEFRRDGAAPVRVVDGVSLRIEAGQSLALVGESGSGKSLTALSIARLLPSPPAVIAGGDIRLAGRSVLGLSPAELRRVRGGVVSYVFQEAGAVLNPVMRIGAQIKECLRLHRPAAATDAEVLRLLRLVQIPAPEARARCYPHELSGGMQQRVMIALALAPNPKLLVADEPTTALDVTIQAQIIELLAELRRTLRMSILLITHNLGLVGDLADEPRALDLIGLVQRGRSLDQVGVLKVKQRLAVFGPRVDANAALPVGGDDAVIVPAQGADPDLQHVVGIRRQPGRALAVRGELRAGAFEIAEQHLPRNQRGQRDQCVERNQEQGQTKPAPTGESKLVVEAFKELCAGI